MKLVTAAEMRELDRQAIEELGFSPRILMERAGMQVADCVKEMCECLEETRIVIVSGKGNNGGDGFVAARHLVNQKANVKVILIGNGKELRGDAAANYSILEKIGCPVEEVREKKHFGKLKREIDHADFVIDAILGTGTKGKVSDFLSKIITIINESEKRIISVDIPSGLDTDRGSILGNCVEASRTVTLALPKRGLYLYPGRRIAGKITIADIGIPPFLCQKGELRVNLMTEDEIKNLLPIPAPDVHKGNRGRVLIIAGSPGLTGAAALASMGALKIGAGLVTLGVPESLNQIMEIKLTEVMTHPLPETNKGTLSEKAEQEILTLAEKQHVVAIGPGLSNCPESISLVRRLLVQISKPIVVDADGLNAIAKDTSLLKKVKTSPVLTPHPGEMARLIGKEIGKIQSNRIEETQNFAFSYGVTLVLKGASTVVADSSGNTCVNCTGNPGMASGGVGDVLTGFITGLIAQGMSCFDAARLGVFIHGRAGDIAAAKSGNFSLTAGELLDELKEAIESLIK